MTVKNLCKFCSIKFQEQKKSSIYGKLSVELRKEYQMVLAESYFWHRSGVDTKSIKST